MHSGNSFTFILFCVRLTVVNSTMPCITNFTISLYYTMSGILVPHWPVVSALIDSYAPWPFNNVLWNYNNEYSIAPMIPRRWYRGMGSGWDKQSPSHAFTTSLKANSYNAYTIFVFPSNATLISFMCTLPTLIPPNWLVVIVILPAQSLH